MTGEGAFNPLSQVLDVAGNPFDRWFIDQIQDFTGINMLELPEEMPELVGNGGPKHLTHRLNCG